MTSFAGACQPGQPARSAKLTMLATAELTGLA